MGPAAWCESLLGRHVAKACTFLNAIGRFPDPPPSTLLTMIPEPPSVASSVTPCRTTTGAWLRSASLPAVSVPGLDIASLAVCCDLCILLHLSIFMMMAVTSPRPRSPSKRLSPQMLVSTPSSMPCPKSRFEGKKEAQVVLRSADTAPPAFC